MPRCMAVLGMFSITEVALNSGSWAADQSDTQCRIGAVEGGTRYT